MFSVALGRLIHFEGASVKRDALAEGDDRLSSWTSVPFRSE